GYEIGSFEVKGKGCEPQPSELVLWVLTQERFQKPDGLWRVVKLLKVDLGIKKPTVLDSCLAELPANTQNDLVALKPGRTIKKPPGVYVELTGGHTALN